MSEQDEKALPKPKRGLIRRLLTWGFFSILGIIGLIALLWYLARPRGDLRIAIDAGQTEEAAKDIRGRFNSAHQQANNKDTLVAFHNRLGLGLQAIVKSPVPGQPGPLQEALSDLIKLKDTSFSFDATVLKFEGEFNGNNILKAMYGWVGWHDHYLVVKNFGPCSTPPVVPDADTCRQMTAAVWPIDNGGTTVAGTTQQLAADLAVYLFKTFLNKGIDSKTVDPAKAIPPAELSNDYLSLEKAARGIEILEQGTSHSSCVSGTPEVCRKAAREMFDQARLRDATNAYAQLGTGLLKLRDVLQMARDGGRVFPVLHALTEAGNHLGAARFHSPTLQQFLDNKDKLARFKLLDLGASHVTSGFIESVAHASRAYHAFVAAKYRDQLDHTKRADLPEQLKSYLRGFEYEARLVLTDSAQEARPLLDELDKLRADWPNVWIYHNVYATHACRFGLFDLARPAIAQALNLAVNNRALFHDTHVWEAICLAREGKQTEADEKIAGVVAFLDEIEKKTPVQQDAQTIYIDLGYYFVVIKQYQSAADYFLKALTGNRCFWPRISGDRQLKAFHEKPEYRKLRENWANLPENTGAGCGE